MSFCVASGVVCARQKRVVCARQKLFVCTRYFSVTLSLYLCNILVDVSSLHHRTTHHCVGFFLTSLCGVFVSRLAFRAFSFSSSVVPPLTQLHPSSLTRLTQPTHLTQILSSHNSLNSSHTTQLTRKLLSCSIWWSCFRVAGARV